MKNFLISIFISYFNKNFIGGTIMVRKWTIMLFMLILLYEGIPSVARTTPYEITIEPDNAYPGWKGYDYAIKNVVIYGWWIKHIIVTIENRGLCEAESGYGWYSSEGRSCWGEWLFYQYKDDVVDIKFRVGDTSPEPGAKYRIELDGVYLGDVEVPATDSWYIVTVHNVPIEEGMHTLFLGTYQMDYYPDYHMDYIMIGDRRIEAEKYVRMGGNDPNPDLQGLTVYPRDIKLQIWDGEPGIGVLLNETFIGEKQLVIDKKQDHPGNTYYAHYIENNGKYTVNILWKPSNRFFHRIYVIVDPYNDLNEINEINNFRSKIVFTIPYLSI